MSTHLDSFSEGVSKYLALAVLPIIKDYLAKKGLTVSVDELLDSLKAPRPSHTQAFDQEVSRSTGGTSTVNNETKSTSVKRTKGDPNGPTCRYIFTKGQKKGDYCGAPCAPGNPERCKSCARKKNGGTATTSSAVTEANGVLEPASSENILDAISVDDRKGLFRESHMNILFQQVGDSYYAKGVLTGGDSLQTRMMNEVERAYCADKGLIIDDQAKPQTVASSTLSSASIQPSNNLQTAGTTSGNIPMSNIDSVLKTLMS